MKTIVLAIVALFLLANPSISVQADWSAETMEPYLDFIDKYVGTPTWKRMHLALQRRVVILNHHKLTSQRHTLLDYENLVNRAKTDACKNAEAFGGNDVYNGGDGDDTLSYLRYSHADFAFHRREGEKAGRIRAIHMTPCVAGVDRLVDIEQIKFSDGTFAVVDLLP